MRIKWNCGFDVNGSMVIATEEESPGQWSWNTSDLSGVEPSLIVVDINFVGTIDGSQNYCNYSGATENGNNR